MIQKKHKNKKRFGEIYEKKIQTTTAAALKGGRRVLSAKALLDFIKTTFAFYAFNVRLSLKNKKICGII